MRVCITGAHGWLARELAKQIKAADPESEVVGCVRTNSGRIEGFDRVLSNTDFLDGLDLCDEDYVIHAAFCRKSHGADLASSLDFSRRVFAKAVRANVSGLVNISSQAVYGSSCGMGSTETSPVAPEYLYALAKVASEMLLDQVAEDQGFSRCTHIRLASLMGVSNGESPVNVLSKFIDRALDGDRIEIVGGSQKFSFLDIEDGAHAIAMLLGKEPGAWERIYNITPDRQVNIVEMAQIVSREVANTLGADPVPIDVSGAEVSLSAGASNARAKESLGWSIDNSFQDIVQKMVQFALANR